MRAASISTAAGAASLAMTGTAVASPFALGPDRQVSGPSALTACPFGGSADFASAYDHAEGGPERFGRVADPWASYDKAGNLYFIGQPIDSAALGVSAISVTTWDGTRWRPPTTLIEDRGDRGVFNDKVSITGDPTRAGHAYATWLRGDFPPGQQQSPVADFHSFAFRGQPMFSRTTDGGATWSTPVPMVLG